MSETPLIDEIYQKLHTAGEKAAFNGFSRPKFQIYLTAQQHHQLRSELIKAVYPVLDSGEFLFGHKIIVVDETPYVE